MKRFILAGITIIFIGCNPEVDFPEKSESIQWTYFSGLPSNFISALFEDKDGKIWVGTDNGLAVYNGSSFTIFTTLDGLVSNNIHTILQDKDGEIVVGTDNGVNYRSGTTWYEFTPFAGVEVNSIIETENRDLLFGTTGFGVWKFSFSTNTLDPYSVLNTCTNCNWVNTLYLDSNKDIWIGTYQGLRRISGGTSTSYSKANGLSGDIVTSIYQDTWGSVWVGTLDGSKLNRFDNGTQRQIGLINGSSQNAVFTMTEDRKGILWIGIVGLGLVHYDGAMMHRIYSGLKGISVICLLRDSKGFIWVGTISKGLAKFKPQD